MFLRTTKNQQREDEKEFREWLTKELGQTDQETLSSFTWELSPTPHGYMNSLAILIRGIAAHGRSHVDQILEIAKFPKEHRLAEIDLTSFSKSILEKLTERVLAANQKDREKVAQDCWLELRSLVKERIEKMWPSAPDYVVNGAVLCGCDWDKQNGSFSINPRKLVEAMTQSDPLKNTSIHG